MSGKEATQDFIEPLRKTHDRKEFACGHPDLDRYLRENARQDADRRVAAPFVLGQPPARRVLGYYTLSSSVIYVEELPSDLARKVPRYPQLPVTLLGRLAIDETMKGKKKGELLLMDALHRSLEAAADIGSMAVVTEPIDDKAEEFYRHFDFQALQGEPRRMFLSMRTIAEIFGGD